MKLKNAVDKQVVVKGYAVEVDSTDDGQITLGLPITKDNQWDSVEVLVIEWVD